MGGEMQAGVPSGEAGVAAVLAALDGLEGVPVAGHVAVFGRVHAGLQEILAASEEPREPREAR